VTETTCAIDWPENVWENANVLKRLSKLVMVASLVCLVGGHWALLQSVAWVGMAVKFSQSEPVAVALKKTFDGAHPCALCKVVTEGKKSEEKRETQEPVTKLEFVSSLEFSLPTPPEQPLDLTAFLATITFRSQAPPSPPPRAA
jgi:hypothetical protein